MIKLQYVFYVATMMCAMSDRAIGEESRPHIQIRGVYGGVPTELSDRGTLGELGINAIFMGSGSLNQERIALLKKQGAKVFAEFNTMHVASYVKDHPDAAPIGVDGNGCPPPQGWQGVCPTHPGYRQFRVNSTLR